MFRRSGGGRSLASESDVGSEDIQTVSDVHTFTTMQTNSQYENEPLFRMSGQNHQHYPNNDHSIVESETSDILTLDRTRDGDHIMHVNDLSSIPQDERSDPGATKGSTAGRTPPGWGLLSPLSFPSLLGAQHSQPEPDHENEDPEVQAHRPIFNTSTKKKPPKMIVLGQAPTNDTLLENNSDNAKPPNSIWKQRLCGIRADRLVCLLVFIMLIAVCVIVGALVYTTQFADDGSSSKAVSQVEDETVDLTRTPIAAPPTTEAPTVFIGQTQSPTPGLVVETTTAPTVVQTIPPTPSLEDEITNFPTLSPMASPVSPAPTTWPLQECGGDAPTLTTFINLSRDAFVSCEWLTQQDAATQISHCVSDQPAYYYCRETCRNCNDDDDTIWPVESCGGDDPSRTFFAGSGLGQQDCAWLVNFRGHAKRLCEPEKEAFQFCRETCRNCGPTLAPTTNPTNEPTQSPTNEPTAEPTLLPPTVEPTEPVLTEEPTVAPVAETESPTETPVEETESPTVEPTIAPTVQEPEETDSPTASPTEPEDEETDAPTASPTEPDESEFSVVDYFLRIYPQAGERAQQEGTPQFLATEWMQAAFNDNTYPPDMDEDRVKQVWALAVFAYSTNVEDWNESNGWLDASRSECRWFGVTCNNDGLVSEVILPENNLQGSFQPEISLVRRNLRILNVSDNKMEGRIPAGVGALENLRELYIDRNRFEGRIPARIGNLESLQKWHMQRNPGLSGSFPDAVLQLNNLVELVFYYTNIDSLPNGICAMNLSVLIFDCVQIPDTSCYTRCFFLCGGSTGIDCDTDTPSAVGDVAVTP